ncbi:MAG: hypothetical protein E7655_09205 [Ruminococcaceae bacterium]|nr:hypothetical protein [Oscillospiraceae bacterium]
MKRKLILRSVFVLLLVVCLASPLFCRADAASPSVWSGETASSFAGGSGTEADPYLIKTAEQLAFLAEQVRNGNTFLDQTIRLHGDLWLNDTSDWESWETKAPKNTWLPIGGYIPLAEPITTESAFQEAKKEYGNLYYLKNDSFSYTSSLKSGISQYYVIRQFKGSFDGNGHTIKGLYLSTDEGAQGLFGYTSLNKWATNSIRNLTLSESFLRGGEKTGGIVGICENDIENCTFRGVVSGTRKVGGIVGSLEAESLYGCINEGTVKGISCCGGIVGESDYGDVITKCANKGTVLSEQYDAGGIAGSILNLLLYNCANFGTVNAASYSGGIVPTVSSSSVVSDCYNAGTVHSQSRQTVGGIAAEVESADDTFCPTLIRCFSLTPVLFGENKIVRSVGTAGTGALIRSVYAFYDTSTLASSSTTGKGDSILYHNASDPASFEDFDFESLWTIEPKSGNPYPQLISFVDSAFGEQSAVWDGSIASGFAGGSGTETDPYRIETAEQLAFFAQSVNQGRSYLDCHIRLDADITLNDASKKLWTQSATQWTPIGGREEQPLPYPITNQSEFEEALAKYDTLYYRPSESSLSLTRVFREGVSQYYYQPAFKGSFNGNGHIIKGLYLYGIKSSQGLFASDGTYSSVIKNLGVINAFVGGESAVSGLSHNVSATISSCFFEGSVFGSSFVNGLAVGTVINSYHMGSVTGQQSVSGLGGNHSLFSYHAGSVSSSLNRHPIRYDGSHFVTFISCYYLDKPHLIDPLDSVYPPCFALTHEQMTQKESFNGFDFSSVWCLDTSSDYPYPTLRLFANPENAALWDGSIASGFAGGSGTKPDPYRIETAEQLALLSYNVKNGELYADTYFKLCRDISFNDTKISGWTFTANHWTPIGTGEYVYKSVPTPIRSFSDFQTARRTYSTLYVYDSDNMSYSSVYSYQSQHSAYYYSEQNAFRGHFDGDGHIISGLFSEATSSGLGMGLFGFVENGSIQNLTVTAANLFASSHSSFGGILAGHCVETVIERCSVSGSIGGNLAYAGGLVGYFSNGSLSFSCNHAAVLGNASTVTGGLIGYDVFGKISSCFNTGLVASMQSKSGGLIGSAWYTTLTDCYNRGHVMGSESVGSLIGEVRAMPHAPATLTNCYSSGTVLWNTRSASGSDCVIGSVSAASSSADEVPDPADLCHVNGVYYLDTEAETSADCVALPLTKEQMLSADSFAGFDFTSVWEMGETDGYLYPILKTPTNHLSDQNGDGVIDLLDLLELAIRFYDGDASLTADDLIAMIEWIVG